MILECCIIFGRRLSRMHLCPLLWTSLTFAPGGCGAELALEEAPEGAVAGIAAGLGYIIKLGVGMSLAIVLNLMETVVLDDVYQAHSQVELYGIG